MIPEQILFLQILSDYISGEKTHIDGDPDWQRIFGYAEAQNLSPVIAYQCADLAKSGMIPGKTVQQLESIVAYSAFLYENRKKLLCRIREEFERSGVEFFSVKGMDIAELYPEPALRTMGDSDIVIRPEKRELSHQAMLNAGFEFTGREDSEYKYKKGVFEVEIHSRLLTESFPIITKSECEYAECAWNCAVPVSGRTHYRPGNEFHFIFLLLHLKKHILESGVGFRQLMDLAVFLKAYGNSMDWERIGSDLKKTGLTEFAISVISLCRSWFKTAGFLDAEPAEPAFSDMFAERIFKGGVFGFADDAYRKNWITNKRYFSGRRGAAAKFVFLLSLVFPPYSELKINRKYSFLNGRPYLLPAAWIYRILIVLKEKITGKESSCPVPGDRDDEQENWAFILEKLGL